jgi:hypothetical protein
MGTFKYYKILIYFRNAQHFESQKFIISEEIKGERL